MKKLILFLIISFFIVSCSKDDEEKVASFSIVGEWDITKFINNGTDWMSVLSSAKLKFLSNGEYEWVMNFITGNQEEVNGTYVINGDNTQVTMTEDGDVSILFTITELTADKLALSASDSGDTISIELSRSN